MKAEPMKSTGLLVLPHTLGVELQQTNAERVARLAAAAIGQIGQRRGGRPRRAGKISPRRGGEKV